MKRYQNNAYRVLGLLPGATLTEIKQRADDLDIEMKLGTSPEYKYDFSFLGPIDRSYENIIGAVERLENPIAKLREEMFYFWIDTEMAQQGLSLLCEGKTKQVTKLWMVTKLHRDNISTAVNLAIISHAIAISDEISGKNIYKTSAHWLNWTLALTTFGLLAKSNMYWECIHDKLEGYKDKRTTGVDIDEVKQIYIRDITTVNSKFISRYCKNKEYSLVEKHVDLLQYFGEGISKHHLNDISKNAQDELDTQLCKFQNWYEKYGNIVTMQELMSITNNFIKGIHPYVAEMKMIDTNNISSFATTLDKVSAFLRDIAIDLNNKPGNEYRDAYKIMQYAYSNCSKYLESRYKEDLRILKNNYKYSTGGFEGYDVQVDDVEKEDLNNRCPDCGSIMILGRCLKCGVAGAKNVDTEKDEGQLSVIFKSPFEKIEENTQLAKDWLISYYEQFSNKKSTESLIDVAQNLMLGIKAIVNVGTINQLGELADESQRTILDQVAIVIGEYARAIDIEGADLDMGMKLYTLAISIVQSGDVYNKLEEECAGLKNKHTQKAERKKKHKYWKNIFLEIVKFPVKVAIACMMLPVNLLKALMKFIVNPIVIISAMVLGGIYLSLFENSSNQNNAKKGEQQNYKVKKNVAPKESSSSKITYLKTQLDTKKEEITKMENSLKQREARMQRIKGEIEDMESKYAYDAPQAVIDDFNSKVELYNLLGTKYNLLFEKYKKEIAAYNELVHKHNNAIR